MSWGGGCCHSCITLSTKEEESVCVSDQLINSLELGCPGKAWHEGHGHSRRFINFYKHYFFNVAVQSLNIPRRKQLS